MRLTGPDGAELRGRRVPLRADGLYRLLITAAEHHPLEATLSFRSGQLERGRNLADDRTLAVTISHHYDNGLEASVHTVYAGLYHRWFSASGRPARRGHDLRLLVGGEEAWRAVHGDLIQAERTLHLATWWWLSNFELIRPSSPAVGRSRRRANTIIGLLDASPATKRVLVSQFVGQDGFLSDMAWDDEMLSRARRRDDRFEAMGHGNEVSGVIQIEVPAFSFAERVVARHPEAGNRPLLREPRITSSFESRAADLTQYPTGIEAPIGSWHQKFIVVDDRVAFVGGMNPDGLDWDSAEHRVFDHRRMEFDASASDRRAVLAAANKVEGEDTEPDYGPYRDYMVRLEGPATQDVADVFQRRWDHLRSESVDHSEATSAFAIDRNASAVAGDLQVQITTTMPPPFREYSIAESQINAIENAERLIFIEDQYWRSEIIADAIRERMYEVPDLQLVVVTNEISEWFNLGCRWTHETDGRLRRAFPDRYHTFRLRAFDWVLASWGWDETEAVFVDLYVHSKLMIVDGKFMSIGSANKNNRGLLFEGEMNIAVLDEDWVGRAQRRVIENLVGHSAGTNDLGGIPELLASAASANRRVFRSWDDEGWDIDLDGDPMPSRYQPRGFLYPLSFRAVSDCLIEDVGPNIAPATAGGDPRPTPTSDRAR